MIFSIEVETYKMQFYFILFKKKKFFFMRVSDIVVFTIIEFTDI